MEQNTPQTNNVPKSMDVVPPKQPPVRPPEAPQKTGVSTDSITKQPQTSQPAPAPTLQGSASVSVNNASNQQTVRPTPPEILAEDKQKEASPTLGHVTDASPEPAQKKKSTAPVAAIILAVLIALVLTGAGVMAFKKPAKKTVTTPTTNEQTTTKSKVDTAEIDATASAIDQGVKQLDDATDFGSNDLTDATLGL